MNIQLAVTPSGRIVAVESSQETSDPADMSPDAVSDQRLEKKIAQQFASSQAEGLFALATERMDRPPNPLLRLLAGFCRAVPDGDSVIRRRSAALRSKRFRLLRRRNSVPCS